MLSDALWHPLDAENYRKRALGPPPLPDRRLKARFPIDLPFRYNARHKAGFSGAGRVVNIGSKYVMVACRRHRLKVGTPVELVIEWPARLDGRIPIHLVMTGTVRRCDSAGFGVGSCQHRFQLVGSPPSVGEPDPLASPVKPDSDAGGGLPEANGSSIPDVPPSSSATLRCRRPASLRSTQPHGLGTPAGMTFDGRLTDRRQYSSTAKLRRLQRL
jgi:hypothetical protein